MAQRDQQAAKGEGTAFALDGRVVRVRAPQDMHARVAFLADVENLSLELAKPRGAHRAQRAHRLGG